ncbi:MAG: serine hydrolase domain-containing protein, partial [Steroidobacteraceae bacterium]
NAWLDGYLPYALHTGDIAGAVVAVVKDGAILTERGFGYSDVAKRSPVDPKLTLFRPGSVSKLFTWTAVMQLVEQGKIDLDADVNQYLDFHIPARDGQPITMRNLMQHTAGFEEQVKGLISADPQAPRFEALLKEWVPNRVYAPGSTPAYSNYGASLAGYIVQRVSGEPFDDYLDKHIFQPLDMPHSTFRQPLPAALEPLMSKGYVLGSDKPHPFEIVGESPAGALSAPADDMAHFMIAHLQDGEYHGNRILRAETAQTMHNSPLTLLPPLNRMELGFFETNINGREVIGHLGDTAYFHTSLHLFLKEGVGFYVSFNSLGKEGAAGTLRNALFFAFADRYFPGGEKQGAVDPKTSAVHAAMVSGRWINSRGSHSTFLALLGLFGQTKAGVNAQGELVLPVHGLNGKPRHWVEIAPFLWRDVDGHDLLAAQVVDGKVVRFSFDEISPFMVFYRAPWYMDGAWLMPLLYAGLGALAITVLWWPIAAIVRRRYGAALALDAHELRAYRASKIGAILILAGLAAWALLVSRMLNDDSNVSAKMDPSLLFTEFFGAIAFIGGCAAILWNLRIVWAGKRRWPAKTWSIVLAISGLAVLWAAWVFNLISFGTNY